MPDTEPEGKASPGKGWGKLRTSNSSPAQGGRWGLDLGSDHPSRGQRDVYGHGPGTLSLPLIQGFLSGSQEERWEMVCSRLQGAYVLRWSAHPRNKTTAGAGPWDSSGKTPWRTHTLKDSRRTVGPFSAAEKRHSEKMASPGVVQGPVSMCGELSSGAQTSGDVPVHL